MTFLLVPFIADWRSCDPQRLLPGCDQPSLSRAQPQPHDRRLRSGEPWQRPWKFTFPAVNDVAGNRVADHDWRGEGDFADFQLRLFRTTSLLIVWIVANNLVKNVDCIPNLDRRRRRLDDGLKNGLERRPRFWLFSIKNFLLNVPDYSKIKFYYRQSLFHFHFVLLRASDFIIEKLTKQIELCIAGQVLSD